MADNGLFDEDDWGDADDVFNQIDQLVAQHSKPGQVHDVAVTTHFLFLSILQLLLKKCVVSKTYRGW